MRTSRKIACAVIVFVVLLIMSSLMLRWYIDRSDKVVMKVLKDPTCRLTKDEAEYLYSDYLPKASIPYTRQARLIRAAFARTSVDSGAMIAEISERWQRDHDTFLMLPTLVNELIFANKDGKQRDYLEKVSIWTVVGTVGLGCTLDSHLDFEYIMRSVTDEKVIWAVCANCHPNSLYAHRDACFTMLKRVDIGLLPKRALLANIAVCRVGRKWFKGKEAILEWLQSFEDESIQESVTRIRKQMNQGKQPGK